jgi:hypothetical protein
VHEEGLEAMGEQPGVLFLRGGIWCARARARALTLARVNTRGVQPTGIDLSRSPKPNVRI